MRTVITACLLGAALVGAGNPASAQVAVHVSTSLDGNRFGGLRDAQEGALAFARNTIGVPAEATDTFPVVPSLRADVVFGSDPVFNAGVEVGVASTGGRVDYQDRTGQYRYDLVVSRVYVGGYGEWVMHRAGGLAVASTLRNRYGLSRLDLDEVLEASGERLTRRDVRFSQDTFSLQPEVTVEARLAGPLGLRLRAGWEQVLFLGEMTSDIEAGDSWIATAPDPRFVNWSGPRVGLGVVLRR